MPAGEDTPRPGPEEVLARAVRERRPVELEYRFPGQGRRTVHPHALYPTSRGTACDVYQVDGYTSPGRALPGWRALDVAQVVDAEPLPGRFPPAPGFNPAAPRYRGGIVAPTGERELHGKTIQRSVRRQT